MWEQRPKNGISVSHFPSRRIGWNRLGPLISGWFGPHIQPKHFGPFFENLNSRSELIGHMNELCLAYEKIRSHYANHISHMERNSNFSGHVLKKAPKAMKKRVAVRNGIRLGPNFNF
jgi:hypothetical protein